MVHGDHTMLDLRNVAFVRLIEAIDPRAMGVHEALIRCLHARERASATGTSAEKQVDVTADPNPIFAAHGNASVVGATGHRQAGAARRSAADEEDYASSPIGPALSGSTLPDPETR